MARYRYTAFDPAGHSLSGAIEASSRESALDQLARQEKLVTAIDVDTQSAAGQRWWERDLFSGGALTAAQLSAVARELATLSSAHVPTDEMLSLMVGQTRLGGGARQLIGVVRERVMEGASLSQAFAASEGAVPEYFWRLVRAGETAGSLPTVLRSLADHLQSANRMRGHVLSALLYPAFLLVTASIALSVIAGVTAPAIAPLFRERGIEPPFALQLLVQLRLLAINWWPMLLAALAAVIVAIFAAARSPTISRVGSRALLRLPIIGQLVTDAQTARLARMLSILIGNRVPVLDAFRAAEGGLTNAVWRSALEQVRADLNEGASISRPLAAIGIMPDLAVRLIAAGERSGQLPEMLGNIADIYEHNLSQSLERATTLLAPILTLVIGCIIGGLMLTLIGSLLAVNELGVR